MYVEPLLEVTLMHLETRNFVAHASLRFLNDRTTFKESGIQEQLV